MEMGICVPVCRVTCLCGYETENLSLPGKMLIALIGRVLIESRSRILVIDTSSECSVTVLDDSRPFWHVI